jgi:transcription elongation GreA/GreB family factor
LTAGEIRDALTGIVSVGEWTSWWASARDSPRVLAEGGGARQRYKAAASDAEAEAAIERAFHDANLAGKLEIYRRQGARNPQLDAVMAGELERLATSTAESDTELVFAVAWALTDVSERIPRGPWTPAERLRASGDPATLVAGLVDRALRERAYRWLRDERPDAAEVLSRALELEGEVRLCDLLAGWLAELAPQRLTDFVDEALRQPRRHTAGFVWLVEQAGSRPELLRRSPLRLLQHVFAALRQDEFKVHRARLRKLCEGGPLLPLLLDAIDAGQAEAAAQAIDRAPLEEYVRAPLLEALAMRFPTLRPPTPAALYALPASIGARREQLRQLREQEIPANRRAIQEARELGDLRENFEYKSARQRHEYLTARAATLERELSTARPIDLEREDCAEVRIAVRVRVNDDGRERTISILGPWESDPVRELVSYDSELGRSLLGKKPGEEVEFAGRRLRVLAIEPWRLEPPA